MKFKDLIVLSISFLVLIIFSVVIGNESHDFKVISQVADKNSLADSIKKVNNVIVKENALKKKTTLPLNKATKKELETLTGIGPTIALRIVEYRNLHGPFNSIDELINIKGIGTKKLATLRSEITVKDN